MMLPKIWARALGHYMGKTDDDMPEIPIISLREANIVLVLKTLYLLKNLINIKNHFSNFYIYSIGKSYVIHSGRIIIGMPYD